MGRARRGGLHLKSSPWPATVPRLAHVEPTLDVSVVIVSFNTRDVLRECLASVFRETREVSFEVIVVDNASADGSADMVATEFPQVRLIRNTENRGFAAACNQGILVTRGRYVLLLNPDTRVLEDAVARTVAYADGHHNAAAVGCQVLNTDGTVQRTCFRYPSVLHVALSGLALDRLPFGRCFFGRERMRDWKRDSEREVEVVTGSCMLLRREAMEEVGLMDEAYFVYGEEADWCFRCGRVGWRVLFTPHARVFHAGDRSTRLVLTAMHVQLRRSILIFIERHYGHAARACANYLMVLSASWHLVAWLSVYAMRGVIGRQGREKQMCEAWAATLGFHLRTIGRDKYCARKPEKGLATAAGRSGGLP
jgi:GT2 family glycosyltransferase